MKNNVILVVNFFTLIFTVYQRVWGSQLMRQESTADVGNITPTLSVTTRPATDVTTSMPYLEPYTTAQDDPVSILKI